MIRLFKLNPFRNYSRWKSRG